MTQRNDPRGHGKRRENDQGENRSFPYEDRAMKMAARFFGKELLALLGIRGKIKRIAPTEQVDHKMAAFYEDFNFEMEDGSWHHFEFESDGITKEDLRRFRVYEAITSYDYHVDVVTNVLCSSSARQIQSELCQGISVFRIHIVRLKDESADLVINLVEERESEHRLTRDDMVKLLLTPLMAGDMDQVERIRKSLRIIQRARSQISEDDFFHMEAVLFAFSEKFLTMEEKWEIKEEMNMTELGRIMLEGTWEKGMEQGMEQGMERLNQLNQTLARLNRTEDIIRSAEDSAYQKKLLKEFHL